MWTTPYPPLIMVENSIRDIFGFSENLPNRISDVMTRHVLTNHIARRFNRKLDLKVYKKHFI